jgi:Amidohydrolase family
MPRWVSVCSRWTSWGHWRGFGGVPRRPSRTRLAYQGEYFVERYGHKAAEATPPIARMLEMGVPVGAGTDATRVASYNPWVSLSWLVTGRTIGGTTLYPPRNRLDRETALRLWTEANTWFSNEQGKKGAVKGRTPIIPRPAVRFPVLYAMMVRKPPLRPCPGRATRCLMRPWPRLASTRPRSARPTASQSASSPNRSRRWNLPNAFVLNTLAAMLPRTETYSTETHKSQRACGWWDMVTRRAWMPAIILIAGMQGAVPEALCERRTGARRPPKVWERP